jgi:hypothetical protein
MGGKGRVGGNVTEKGPEGVKERTREKKIR